MTEDKMHNIRHSLAHIMAMAVLKKFPDAKLGIGPVIDNGFYYDFLLPEKLSDADIPKIQKEMKKIIQQKIEFTKEISSRSDALKKVKDNKYKKELVDELPDNEEISFYACGDFEDLCAGPHVKDSSEIKANAFALTSIAGAYWRGDEKNDMLTRIYGVAFANKEELDEYLLMLEEAKKRDHRKLGKELDLFTFSELVGAGLALWTPKGTVLRNELDNYVWELRRRYDYQAVTIPHITKKDLYETSGHWDKFSDELFKITTREGHEFAMKPMNCPHHTQIYAHLPRSYRDLPQRYAETTMVYRDEQSGELVGLSRVRCISQDDAHVFCRDNQVKEEILKIVDIVENFYKPFGFDLKIRLSLHDPDKFDNYIGSKDNWAKMEKQLRGLLKEQKIEHYEAIGEAAMYGPKIDFITHDSLKREWQVATIQLDRNMPERFKLTCTNEDNKEESVVMLHAAITGSIERFIAILIEHLGGNFPLWCSPVQIKIMSVGASHIEFCKNLKKEFIEQNLRIELDDGSETIGNKIRKNATQRIPYTLVIGDKEMNSKKLSVRVRGQKDLLEIDKSEFVAKIKEDIKNRTLELL
jgi:threonyl-tRNA synthetase